MLHHSEDEARKKGPGEKNAKLYRVRSGSSTYWIWARDSSHARLLYCEAGNVEFTLANSLRQPGMFSDVNDLLQQAEDSFEQCRNVLSQIRRILYGNQ